MQKLYAVRDQKSEQFSPPLSYPAEGVARRAFVELAADQRSELSKYPEDFWLYEIGVYDPNSGEIAGTTPPKLIMTGTAAQSQARQDQAKREAAKGPVSPVGAVVDTVQEEALNAR